MATYKARKSFGDLYIPADMLLAYSQQGYTIIRVDEVIIDPKNIEQEMENAVVEQQKYVEKINNSLLLSDIKGEQYGQTK